MTDSGFDPGFCDPQQAGVFFVTSADLAPLHAALQAAGLQVLRIDLHDCADKSGLLARIVTALEIPDGRGLNWDSLSDAVRDLSWLPAPGHALLFDGGVDLRDADEESFDVLLEILEQAASDWADVDRAFWAFLALPEDEFDTGH